MKTADRFQRTLFPSKRAGRNHFISNRLGQQTVWARTTKLIKDYHHILEHVTMLLFTATVFLGTFYLFLVKLAESGW